VLYSARLPLLQPADAPAIYGAADDRTFVITDGTGLFLLHLAGNGRPTELRRLPIVLVAGADRVTAGNVALSPDGSTVAVENQPSCGTTFQLNGCRINMIRLVSLATGATKTWSTRARWQPPMWISWDGNDHVLFSWASAPSPHQSGYRLLDVRAASSDLLAASRVLPLPPLPVLGSYAYEQTAFVTPDGMAVVASTFNVTGSGNNTTMIMQVVEWSARTGRLIQVLREAAMDQRGMQLFFDFEGCDVMSLGPTGVHALVQCTVNMRSIFGRVDNGRFTPLPGVFVGPDPDPPGVAAW
jgi:hypothetical protein